MDTSHNYLAPSVTVLLLQAEQTHCGPIYLTLHVLSFPVIMLTGQMLTSPGKTVHPSVHIRLNNIDILTFMTDNLSSLLFDISTLHIVNVYFHNSED